MKISSNCGHSLADEALVCNNCQTALQASAGAPAEPQTSGKAIASLVLSFFSLLLVPAIMAIVFGHISLSEIKKSAGRLKGQGLAIAGLVIGYCSVAFVPFLLIVAAIAIPNLLRARVAANQASAVGCLRTFNTAAITYSNEYNRGFPKNISVMGPPPGNAQTGEQGANLIDSPLASGMKSGYKFTYTPLAMDNKGNPRGYTIQADSIGEGTTGQRHFFTDESGVIRSEMGKPANKESPPLM